MTTSRSFDYWLLWGVALTSLVINVVLITVLLNVRRQVADGITRAADMVGNLQGVVIEYTVQIDREVPINTVVPIKTTLSVPFQANVPINTQVSIPLDTPLGSFPLNFPIQTNVPISLTAQVPIDAEFPVQTMVPIKLDVPIRIPLGDTGLGTALTEAQTTLRELAKMVGGK